MSHEDSKFAGSIPALYDRYLGPLIFEPYAADLAQRLSGLKHGSVLEIAAGTGILTWELARTLPHDVAIVATDLNQPMLDFASAKRYHPRAITWQQANALDLPFENESFDVVVCQFGVMFFPDKSAAYREILRVLKPGGLFLFSVWDRYFIVFEPPFPSRPAAIHDANSSRLLRQGFDPERSRCGRI